MSDLKTTSTLYVVATPIGNLGDITLRALEILKGVDSIAAEDTRHTSGLLSHFGLSKKLIAVHEHNEHQSAEKLLAQLNAGENIALVTDAGTPGISDPGAVVVDFVRKAGINVMPIPGVSALIAALSASGIAQNGFLFHGFLPASGAARRKTLEALKPQTVTLVFYEAPHRIVESVNDMANVLGAERRVTFARELTKTFETIYTCHLADAKAWLEADTNQQRGEFVLLVEAAAVKEPEEFSDETVRVLKLLLADLPLKQAVKITAEITQEKKNDLYEFALTLKNAKD
ncbi:MAG: 16S rRNA (cytidine(1402)-2'-O)-methyltransferase [Proteobacteria bacterium ST_bin12]|nr:MAG: 16S rRNA (cytidine(1402)-2'-O)-methyltransferase [Proteobacteria bacterium ST_bin12]